MTKKLKYLGFLFIFFSACSPASFPGPNIVSVDDGDKLPEEGG
jgi:hypothetical protein